ncbi:hypothetical protein E4U21_007648 [Claviceps maximensis]|nr:hypothetical protein E4U21_007648 [Claviceps maximensis]
MPANSVVDVPPQSTSTQEIAPRRCSSLDSASVPYSGTSDSEPPMVVPPRNAKRNSKILLSSTEKSMTPEIWNSSCSASGDQDSSAGAHFSDRALASGLPCSAVPSPDRPEVESRQHVFDSGANRQEGEQFATTPIATPKKTKFSSTISERKAGAEKVVKSIVGPLPPPPPPSHKRQPTSQTKNNARAAEIVTSDTKGSKRRSFWFQSRRAPKPASPPLQAEEKCHRRSVAESESSDFSVHTPTSTNYTFDSNSPGTSGWETSVDTEPRIQSHNAVATMSGIRKIGAPKGNLGQQELPYNLAVVIPDGKLFENELEFLDLLSI